MELLSIYNKGTRVSKQMSSKELEISTQGYTWDIQPKFQNSATTHAYNMRYK
jgi:hypothetical protein